MSKIAVNSDAMSLWNALKARDSRYYSMFLYGVKSTKIYCRPTCNSRKPRNVNNVVFFSNSSEAQEAGFRPCSRCTPNQSEQPKQFEAIKKICEYVVENSNDRLTLANLGAFAKMSPFHLQRTFKKVIGVSPREYIEGIRLAKLKMSLWSGSSVRQSTYSSGYKTTGWLYFRPNEKLGMSPLMYKSGGEGLDIKYVTRECPLGRLIVAATESGVCRVSLGDTDQKLIGSLQAEFPKANVRVSTETDGDVLSDAVEKIMEYLTFGKDLKDSKLPLDFQATAFQIKVWKELKAIPFGRVRTYGEVAKRVGLPKATRAVANACGANPFPLVIPCHRVVAKGGLGGYGLGLDRKKKLLEKEGFDLSTLEENRK